MTSLEREYYNNIKNNPEDYVFNQLFFIENNAIKPIEGKWFKLLADGIPIIISTSERRAILESITEYYLDEIHPLDKIRTSKPFAETSNPTAPARIFRVEIDK